MSWVKLATGFYRHPKALAAGPDGRNLFVAAICWCGEYNTDGAIPAYALPTAAMDAGIPVDQAGAVADRLVDVQLWERTPDGWRVHGWAEWQTTAEEREAKAAAARERKARWKERVRNASGTASGTPDEQQTETETETEAEAEAEAEASNSSLSTPPGRPRRRERDALAHLARHLAAGADNPDAYAARVVQQAVQLPALSALAADHPDATGPELAALYLAGQPASDQPAPRAPRCGICHGDPHPGGAADCPRLELGPGLLEVSP